MALTQKSDNVDRYNTGQKGYNGVSLTNFDNTSAPQIASGSVFEIGGALFEASVDESITGWAGISNGTDAYIYVTDGGLGTATAAYSATAPTWDTSKQGWYNGLTRAIAGLYKVDAGTYANKYVYTLNGDKVFSTDDQNSSVAPIFYLKYISNTQIPTTGGGAKIPLDTVVYNNIAGASLVSGAARLKPGVYRITSYIKITDAGGVQNAHSGQIYDSTGATVLEYVGLFDSGTTDHLNGTVKGSTIINLTTISDIELRIIGSGGSYVSGDGSAISINMPASMIIEKVG